MVFYFYVIILRKNVLFLSHMKFAKILTHSAPSDIASQCPPPLRLNNIIGIWATQFNTCTVYKSGFLASLSFLAIQWPFRVLVSFTINICKNNLDIFFNLVSSVNNIENVWSQKSGFEDSSFFSRTFFSIGHCTDQIRSPDALSL
jgi:hypothetical protein